MSARLSIVAPVVTAPSVVSCSVVSPTVVGPAANAPTDPLSFLDDDFGVSILDPKWLTYEGNNTLISSVSGGELDLTCDEGWGGSGDPTTGGVVMTGTGSLWFGWSTGVLLYQAVTGDFDARAVVRVRNTADDGLPTTGDGVYRVAGLACHDPDRASTLNYFHVGLGCVASAAIECEWKDTRDSVSTFAAHSDADTASGTGEIRLLRQGDVYTAFYRAASSAPWVTVQARDRSSAPLPDTLHVGLMAYASTSAHDIRIFVDSFHVTTPS